MARTGDVLKAIRGIIKEQRGVVERVKRLIEGGRFADAVRLYNADFLPRQQRKDQLWAGARRLTFGEWRRARALRVEGASIAWLERLLALTNNMIAGLTKAKNGKIFDAETVGLRRAVHSDEENDIRRILNRLQISRKYLIRTIKDLRGMISNPSLAPDKKQELRARNSFAELKSALELFLNADITVEALKARVGIKRTDPLLYRALATIDQEAREAIAICEKLEQTQGRLARILENER